jgi:hypothetical protein
VSTPSVWLAGALLCVHLVAAATLGETEQSIQADSVRMAGVHRQAAGLAVQVHTLTTADGSTVREYAAPGGRVFAISWNTHYKPRLDQLLGAHFAAYADAGRALQQQPGLRHGARVQQGDLVVESSAHLNAHVGRAYLRSLLPAGVAIDAIR